MRASTDRILTTHVGSLPRTQSVVDLLAQKEAGEPYDRAAFDAATGDAVAEIVRKQRAAGVDVVSDGEQSKPSYATYVKDRLTGFSGDSPARTAAGVPEGRRSRGVLRARPAGSRL